MAHIRKGQDLRSPTNKFPQVNPQISISMSNYHRVVVKNEHICPFYHTCFLRAEESHSQSATPNSPRLHFIKPDFARKSDHRNNFLEEIWHVPSGYLLHSHGKSLFLIGKPSINGPFSMAMLNRYGM